MSIKAARSPSASTFVFSLFFLPLAFLVLAALALFLYKVDVPQELLGAIFVVYMALAVFGLMVDFSTGRICPEINREVKLSMSILFALTFVVSFLEYYFFGFPFFHQVIYANFGFSVLHHVAVTSWIGVPLFFIYRRGWLRWVFLLFAAVNPVLMLNRDMLLLTFFVFICSFSVFARVSLRWVSALIAIAVVSFVGLGEMRSPGVIATIDLPFSFGIESSFLRWLVIYATSSMFNVYSNIMDMGVYLYDIRINVFPEPYLWSSRAGSLLAGLLFYGGVFCFLAFLRVGAQRNPWLLVLLMYFLYQAYMSAFSVKVLTTNSLFVVMFIALGFFLSLLMRTLCVLSLHGREASYGQ